MIGEQQRERLPEALRAAVRGDFAPVTPLAPPWRRACLLALPALIVLATAVLILERTGSAAGVLSFARGGFSALEWLAGLALLWLSLREAVPGLGVGAGRAGLALAGGIALQLALGLLLWQRTGAALSGPGAVVAGAQCATIEGAIGLPHLAVAIWLALRALPLRPRWSGALAGSAAGLLADAVWHLACARNDLEHLLIWHLGATLAMALLGALWGSIWRPRAPATAR